MASSKKSGKKKDRAELRTESDKDLVHHTKRLARTDAGGREQRASMVEKMKRAKFSKMSTADQADFVREQQNERAAGIRTAQKERFEEILERLEARPAKVRQDQASPAPN